MATARSDLCFILFGALAVLSAGTTSIAHAFDLPVYRGPVNDYASMFSPAAHDELERELRAYQAQSGHQFAVLTIPTLNGLTIEDYSHRAAVGFRLGSEKADDGLLLVIAKRERKMRIEVGYGLEGSIPDAVAARLLRQTVRPALAHGDPAVGVLEAFRSLMRAAASQDMGFAPGATTDERTGSLHMRDDAELLSVASRRHVAEQLEQLARSTRHTLAFVSVRCPHKGALEACAEQARRGPVRLHAKGVDETLVIFFRRVKGQLQVLYVMQGKLKRAIAKQIINDFLEPRMRQGDADGAVEAAFRRLVVLSGGQWQERPERFTQPPPSPSPERVATSLLSEARERSDDTTATLWFWLLGGSAFLGFWVWMHRQIYAGPGGTSSGDGSSGSDSSSWSSGDSGGSSSDSSSSGGGGDFGGGGASSDW